jgi:hypothetical protein
MRRNQQKQILHLTVPRICFIQHAEYLSLYSSYIRKHNALAHKILSIPSDKAARVGRADGSRISPALLNQPFTGLHTFKDPEERCPCLFRPRLKFIGLLKDEAVVSLPSLFVLLRTDRLR